MGTIEPHVLPSEARAVLDRLNVRTVAEYPGGSGGRDSGCALEDRDRGRRARSSSTEITHLQIGNVELERRRAARPAGLSLAPDALLLVTLEPSPHGVVRLLLDSG
jgi:hypothetical protein